MKKTKNYKKILGQILKALLILIISFGLIGCDLVQPFIEKMSKETDLYKTQTASVPTNTPAPTATYTNTPMPTNTPTPTASATPEFTLTPTSYPLPEGWIDHTIGNFKIGLPEAWTIVDIGAEGFEAVKDILGNLNNEWAQTVNEMFSAQQMQDMMKFFAIDPEPVGLGYASINLTFQDLPLPVTAKATVEEMKLIFEQMGLEVTDIQTELSINDVQAARLTLRLPLGNTAIKEYAYIFVDTKQMWVLTMSVEEIGWDDYNHLFEAIAGTFRTNLIQ